MGAASMKDRESFDCGPSTLDRRRGRATPTTQRQVYQPLFRGSLNIGERATCIRQFKPEALPGSRPTGRRYVESVDCVVDESTGTQSGRVRSSASRSHLRRASHVTRPTRLLGMPTSVDDAPQDRRHLRDRAIAYSGRRQHKAPNGRLSGEGSRPRSPATRQGRSRTATPGDVTLSGIGRLGKRQAFIGSTLGRILADGRGKQRREPI